MSGIIPASGDNRSAAQWPPQSPGQKPYPEMAKVSDQKPLLQRLGASGTAIFSGIITSEEYNPDFYWRDGVKLYEQMLRSDGQIRAIRTVLENPIKRATWSIEPGSASPRDKEIASFVESCLFHDIRYTTATGRTRAQSWAQILHHILMHLWYGFMAFEVNWRVEDGWVKWAKWEPLLPRTIWRWWVGPDTELEGIQQWTFKDWNYAFVDIPVEKLLLFVHQQEGANFEGLSLLRTAYKHWWYKQNFEKIEAIGIERNAVVPPVITLPENFTSADIAAAQTLGANMRASELGYATLPPGWLLEYPKNMQPFTAHVQPAIQYHDVMIARNVLAQFVNLGSTETGAFALADAQQEMFLEALEAVTDYICDIISNDAICRLVDYNFDNVEVYPKLRASKLANADITQVADALGKLKAREANFINPDPEMEDYLREQFGFPKAPRSVIQATNPTAESNAARPENANAQDHTTQQPTAQRAQPQPVANQAQVSAATNAIAPSSPGDGGALSEPATGGLSQDVHLLAESLASIVNLDVVERGMRFYNPNHDPSNGEFSSGGGGGGGGGGGEASGGAKASGKRAGSRKPSGGAKAAKAPKETIHETSARLQREGGLKAEVKPEFTDKELHNGGSLKSTLVPEKTWSTHEAEHRARFPEEWKTGIPEINPAKTPNPHELSWMYGEHQLGAVLALHTNGQLRDMAHNEGLPTTGSKAALISRITSRVTEGRYSANFAKAEEAPKSGRAKAEAKSATPRASKTSSKPAEEEMHAKSAQLQREGHLPAEVKPGSEIHPIANLEGEFRDPSAPLDMNYLGRLYGEHQLGAVLSRYTTARINESAHAAGVKPGRSRDETISRLTAHATGGRYSANFGAKGVSAAKGAVGAKSSKPSPAEAHAAKAAQLKAALDKAQAAYDAHMAKAPKLSEQSAHALEAGRLWRAVRRAQASLEQLTHGLTYDE